MGQGIRGVHAARETSLGHTGPHQRSSEKSPEGGSGGLCTARWEPLCPFTWLGFFVISATSQVAAWQNPTCSSRLDPNAAPLETFGRGPSWVKRSWLKSMVLSPSFATCSLSDLHGEWIWASVSSFITNIIGLLWILKSENA